MDEELLELKDRIVQLSDDQLLQMVTVDADEYRQEAIDFAKVELRARRIDFTKVSTDVPEPRFVEKEVDKEPDAAPAAPPRVVCLNCGTDRMRPGTLVAERELSIIFSDTREERFVKVMACSRCGQLSLTVNYDEEVEK